MTCLEAQSKIMAFIENKLPDDELKEFIKHVKNCENCSEELEIYYTLIVGMKELDNEENLSTNFKKELDDKLDEEMTRMTAVKRIATSTIVLVLAAIVIGLVWYIIMSRMPNRNRRQNIIIVILLEKSCFLTINI